jgi:2,3-bisphosphoglycerate-dependent phosphoglycerate mutase
MMKAYKKSYMIMVVGLGVVLGTTGVGVPFSESFLSNAIAAESPTTVLILQHAERFDFTKTNDDPELTPDGKQRAQDLAHAVGTAGVAAIFSPKAKRMVQTVQPLQQELKWPELKPYEQGSLNSMLQQIRDQYQGQVVLIVGAGRHMGSGGIHDIIKDLGCTGPECAAKDAYDNLIVVTIYGPDKATAAKLRYGKPVKPQP